MPRPELEYDVYNTPRIGPVQFGDFVAGDGSERERILQGAKFVRRTHRVRAWFARQEITRYLSAPRRNLGALDAALEEIAADASNSSFSDEKREDAAASLECLRKFMNSYDGLLHLGQKDVIALDEDQFPVRIGDITIDVELACLIKSTSRQGASRVGALFLNTQAGKGLGSREDTVLKRIKAGETVALLVLKKITDEFSDLGKPFPEDSLHYYVRHSHVWRAPKSHFQRFKNLDAEARMISRLWAGIPEPGDFDPSLAKFHD